MSANNWAAIQKYCVTQVDQTKCQAATNQAYTDFNGINIYDPYGDCFSQRPMMRLTPEGPKVVPSSQCASCNPRQAGHHLVDLL